MVEGTPSADFEKIGEDEHYRGYVIRVTESTFRAPDGTSFTRDTVYSPGAVAIVPIIRTDDGPAVVMVRQYRAPIEDWLLEIPAGLRDKPGEDPVETAHRELAEEVGYAAGDLVHLNTFYAAAGMTDQQTIIYLGTDLTEVPSQSDGIEEDYMTIETLPVSAIDMAIEDGRVRDAKTIIGLRLALDRLS